MTIAAVGLPLAAERRAKVEAENLRGVAKAAESRVLLTFNDLLDPVVLMLGELVDDRRASPRLAGSITMAVLGAVSNAVGGDRTRACLFLLDDGPPRALRCDRFVGRAGKPRPAFHEGTGVGDRALAMIDRGEQRLFSAAESKEDGSPGSAYRTYIAVPVATPKRTIGMLTVDSPDDGCLNTEDIGVVSVFAGLLALALR